MTLQEFSLEFDVLYDNIASKGAPGLNSYEKSVFLTQAQEEIVKNYYSGFNETQQSFEKTENRRVELKELHKTYKTTTPIDTGNSKISLVSSLSKLFKIPDDVWYITFEQAKIRNSATDPLKMCEEYIDVKPIPHDELILTITKNPFRKPNKRKILRVDISSVNNNNVVELISQYPVAEYFIRYIKKPRPIVLSNFEEDSELADLNLSIDGRNTATNCELRDEVHRDILNRAVELAVRSYRENNLSNLIQTNNRVV